MPVAVVARHLDHLADRETGRVEVRRHGAGHRVVVSGLDEDAVDRERLHDAHDGERPVAVDAAALVVPARALVLGLDEREAAVLGDCDDRDDLVARLEVRNHDVVGDADEDAAAVEHGHLDRPVVSRGEVDALELELVVVADLLERFAAGLEGAALDESVGLDPVTGAEAASGCRARLAADAEREDAAAGGDGKRGALDRGDGGLEVRAAGPAERPDLRRGERPVRKRRGLDRDDPADPDPPQRATRADRPDNPVAGDRDDRLASGILGDYNAPKGHRPGRGRKRKCQRGDPCSSEQQKLLHCGLPPFRSPSRPERGLSLPGPARRIGFLRTANGRTATALLLAQFIGRNRTDLAETPSPEPPQSRDVY